MFTNNNYYGFLLLLSFIKMWEGPTRASDVVKNSVVVHFTNHLPPLTRDLLTSFSVLCHFTFAIILNSFTHTQPPSYLTTF